MVDITEAYDALRKADAAGNTADAKALADYIRSQTQSATAARGTALGEEPAGDMERRGFVPQTGTLGAVKRALAARSDKTTMADRASETALAFGRGTLKAGLGGLGDIGGSAIGLPTSEDVSQVFGLKETPPQYTGAEIVGGLIGPGLVTKPLGAAGRAIGGAAEGVSNWLNPKNVALLQAAEGKGPEILNALRAPTTIVPGSAPTAAQAASPVGSTLYSALEKQVSKEMPTAYVAREDAQAAARLAALRTVAQNEEALAAAKSARKVTANELYGAAETNIIPSDEIFRSLMFTPSGKAAMARAEKLAAEKKQPFKFGEDTPEQVVQTKLLDAQGNPITQVIPAETAQYPVSSLHHIKTAMDDLIKNPERFGIGATEAGAIKNTRDNYLTWLEKTAPEYKVARETFAKQSAPINTMEIGQYLEGKLVPALGEDAAQRAAVYSEALRNAPGTIQKATTGMPRFDSLTKVLSADDVKTLESIRADLAREARTGRLAREGARAESIVPSTEAPTLPNMMNRAAAVANTVMRKLQGKIDKKIAIEIAMEMLDPNMAAAALEKALAYEARNKSIAQAFKTGGASAARVARASAFPAAVNALAPSSTNQNALAQ